MRKTKIFRNKVTIATLHNRRDFGKRLDKLEKFAKATEKKPLKTKA